MAAPMEITTNQLRVSSVLNRDTKQFGKKFLTDGEEDTCWNSDQGSPQWISITFDQPVSIEELRLQFQGGFAGRECWVEGKTGPDSDFTRLEDFYPEDNNSLQIFKLDKVNNVTAVKLMFNTSTDFFGRITIYRMELAGS